MAFMAPPVGRVGRSIEGRSLIRGDMRGAMIAVWVSNEMAELPMACRRAAIVTGSVGCGIFGVSAAPFLTAAAKRVRERSGVELPPPEVVLLPRTGNSSTGGVMGSLSRPLMCAEAMAPVNPETSTFSGR
jgi:hypothetical protein